MTDARPIPLAEARRRRKAADAGGPGARAPDGESFDPLSFNRDYAAVLLESRCMILRERGGAGPFDRLQLLSVEAFEKWTANRVVWGTDKRSGEPKAIPASRLWLQHPERRQYDGIVFEPGGPEIVEGAYNLWRGFEVARDPSGDPSLFLDHLLRVVAGGSAELYRWIVGWFAHLVQRPRERIGTALALRGGQGAGKTIVGRTIGRLIETNYVLVDDPHYLTGNFNAHLAGCLLLQADEGFWAGDKTAEGRLKGLITSDVQMIERKHQDAVRVKNFVRLLVTSNEDWVVPSARDERRWAVVDVDGQRARDHDYFAALSGAMARPDNLGALLDFLLEFDLSTVDLRDIPKTAGLYEQKVRSLDAFGAWWLERLREGTQLPGEAEWASWVAIHRLVASYVASAERVGARRRANEVEFGIALRKWLAGPDGRPHPALARKRWYDTDDHGMQKRTWGYHFPPLAEARAAFERAVGQAVDWDEDADDG